ncbi:hypothetical protein EU546_01090 [Candidatus Thorarchaeota archaeon]|nr:MAG: hypothetical protein EU546_01090 [Candidatus Thorarchaeota archaeon]
MANEKERFLWVLFNGFPSMAAPGTTPLLTILAAAKHLFSYQRDFFITTAAADNAHFLGTKSGRVFKSYLVCYVIYEEFVSSCHNVFIRLVGCRRGSPAMLVVQIVILWAICPVRV